MNRLTITFGVALLLASGLAQAHAHLQSSTPVEGSTLSTAPTTLELKFSEAVTVTALTLGKSDEKGQALQFSTKEPVEKVTAAIPALTPGKYVISYRVVSDDNHVMSGTVHFTLGSGASTGAMDHSKMPGMDHSKMPGMDHGGAGNSKAAPANGTDAR